MPQRPTLSAVLLAPVCTPNHARASEVTKKTVPGLALDSVRSHKR